jgi:hypothetical protein
MKLKNMVVGLGGSLAMGAALIALGLPFNYGCNLVTEQYSAGWWAQILAGCWSIFDEFYRRA